jgi:Ice-binding-like
MNSGVPPTYESPRSDSLVVSRRPCLRASRKTFRAGLLLLGSLSTLIFASSAMGAAATVGLGTAESFSVLAGSTIENTGSTTMSGDLGLSPGSSVTGAPHVLGGTHEDDAVAIGAKTALTTAYNDAASRESSGSAGTDLASQSFTPGVYTASSSLLLSSGTVTLNAQGNPNAVFIFQVKEALTTSSNTSVSLVNEAKACNVFWQIGSSATLGTGTHFVGTIMAKASITANSAATIEGRLLAETGAVTLENNTITTSSCASPSGGSPSGGAETTTGGGTASGAGTTTTTTATGAVASLASATKFIPIASKSTPRKPAKKAAKKHTKKHPRSGSRASKGGSLARPALPNKRAAFTG